MLTRRFPRCDPLMHAHQFLLSCHTPHPSLILSGVFGKDFEAGVLEDVVEPIHPPVRQTNVSLRSQLCWGRREEDDGYSYVMGLLFVIVASRVVNPGRGRSGVFGIVLNFVQSNSSHCRNPLRAIEANLVSLIHRRA